jgi:hypothetical protein
MIEIGHDEINVLVYPEGCFQVRQCFIRVVKGDVTQLIVEFVNPVPESIDEIRVVVEVQYV